MFSELSPVTFYTDPVLWLTAGDQIALLHKVSTEKRLVMLMLCLVCFSQRKLYWFKAGNIGEVFCMQFLCVKNKQKRKANGEDDRMFQIYWKLMFQNFGILREEQQYLWSTFFNVEKTGWKCLTIGISKTQPLKLTQKCSLFWMLTFEKKKVLHVEAY